MQVWILCNDCGSTNEVFYHVIAHKCAGCHSYNTRLIRGSPSPTFTWFMQPSVNVSYIHSAAFTRWEFIVVLWREVMQRFTLQDLCWRIQNAEGEVPALVRGQILHYPALICRNLPNEISCRLRRYAACRVIHYILWLELRPISKKWIGWILHWRLLTCRA